MKICYTFQNVALELRDVNYLNVQRNEGYLATHYDGRKQHSFLYTSLGTVHYHFTDNTLPDISASAGELVFIPAGTRHNSSYIDAVNNVILIQFDLATGNLPAYLTAPSLIKMDMAEKLFSSICNDLQAGAGDNPMYILYRVYELLWHMSQNIERLPVKYRKLQVALREIHLYYSDNHSIEYYADLCGMSESGFRRLFKEYTHMSPIEYRNVIRLQEAKKLLNSGLYSIEEAAATVGYSNLSFFCRSYKALFGNSPGKDR